MPTANSQQPTAKSTKQSEVRVYTVIIDLLKELGWNTKSPGNGGQIYNQNEIHSNLNLQKSLEGKIPDFCVSLGENEYWIIEAKAKSSDMPKALEQAKVYAEKINRGNGNCQFISGVVGDVEKSFYIETWFFYNNKWERVLINNRASTGFFTLIQLKTILKNQKYFLNEYDIDDELFIAKMQSMNSILHESAINKRDRAGVIACLLLAIANDPFFQVSDVPTILINDINTRAKQELKKYQRDNFYTEICIKPPISKENHLKYKTALSKCLGMLRGLNIASTIGCGRDIIGQCYELFLKYANDAKEIGIVLTPRHITQFAVSVLNINKNDIILDPCCGTGGFLVSALDYVKEHSGRDIDKFKKSNLYGIEQEPFVAVLAIVNMVFRGDGYSNIHEGDCFKKELDYINEMRPSKVLMNPPFALKKDFEHHFVDRALKDLETGGELFAVLPTTAMGSVDDKRKEKTWRENLLKRHTLVAVVKLPNELFKPVSKGTYAVIIRAHIPHSKNRNVFWGIMDDGVVVSKTRKKVEGNLDILERNLKNFLHSDNITEEVERELDCLPIKDFNDLTPECHIKSQIGTFDLNIDSVLESQERAKMMLKYRKKNILQITKFKQYRLFEIFDTINKGSSGRKKELSKGNIPLISTSELNNGISSFVEKSECKKIYSDAVVISANGSSCYATYHPYEFAANPDVFVCKLKSKYKKCGLFICGLINIESWRYDYYRKFSQNKLKSLMLSIPVNKKNEPDIDLMEVQAE